MVVSDMMDIVRRIAKYTPNEISERLQIRSATDRNILESAGEISKKAQETFKSSMAKIIDDKDSKDAKSMSDVLLIFYSGLAVQKVSMK